MSYFILKLFRKDGNIVDVYLASRSIAVDDWNKGVSFAAQDHTKVKQILPKCATPVNYRPNADDAEFAQCL